MQSQWWQGKFNRMDVYEHRLLTSLLRRERYGINTLFITLMELEGYLGQIGDLQHHPQRTHPGRHHS